MGRTMRTMVVPGVVAAVALASVLAGCGQGDGTEEVTVVQDLDLMEGIDAAGSARVAFRAELEMPTFGPEAGAATRLRTTMDGEGVVGFGTREATWSATWAIEAVPPAGSVDEYLARPAMNVEVIEAGAGGWSRFWAEGEDVPGWDEHETDDEELDEGEAEAGLLDPTALDPLAFLDRLREEAGTVTVVGEEELRGDTTTRYRAEVAADLVGEDLSAGTDDDEITVDVWVDEDRRLRQVEAGGMHLELWDFGTPVDATPPTDLAEPDDLGFFDDALPQVTGEWEAVARGTAGDTPWVVHAAEGTILGTPTTCRTLEPDGDTGADPGFDGFGGLDEVPIPMHGSVLATCGNGSFGALTNGFVAEPVVQVLSLTEGLIPDVERFDQALVGFVVAPDHVAGGLTIVRDGAEPVELALDDGGIAVWDGADSDAITALELDGGAIRCTYAAIDEEMAPSFEPGAIQSALGLLPPTCVEA